MFFFLTTDGILGSKKYGYKSFQPMLKKTKSIASSFMECFLNSMRLDANFKL